MTTFDASSWMGAAAIANPKVLDLPIGQFPLPGSHDAGSYGGINVKSKTQHYAIKEQLERGVRYFDFRVRVDNGYYFSHHGPDESRDNPYTEMNKQPGKTYIFDVISEFVHAHPTEIVIMNFQDFTAVQGQSFIPKDGDNFAQCMKRDFKMDSERRDYQLWMRPLQDPYPPLPPYSNFIGRASRVFAIVNDGTGNQIGGFHDWMNYPWFWLWTRCLRDRFSGYNYATHTWEYLIDETIADQQNYLVAKTGDSRDLTKFWVSQAILGYDNFTTPNGGSQNKDGASHINKPLVDAYKKWWAGQSATSNPAAKPQRPNVFLLDYSTVFETFAQDCFDMLASMP